MSRTALPQGPETRSEVRSSKQLRARLLQLLPPWIGWVVLWLLSAVFYVIWGRDYTARPWLAIGLLLSTAALASWVWLLASARSDMIRGLSTGTTVAGGVWLTIASMFPPVTRGIVDVYGLGGFVTCLFWNYRRAMLAEKGQGTVAQGTVGKFMAALDGARVGKVRTLDTPGAQVVEARVEVNRGEQTVADLQKKIEDIETTLGLRRGAVSIDYDHEADDAGMALARFAPVNPLQGATLWTGPDNPGASIGEPIRIGTYETGEPAVIYLPGDVETGRNLAHWLIGGVNGAGKTEAFRAIAANALCRPEVSFMVSDPRKAIQFLKPFLDEHAFERVALTEPGGRALADALDAAITARANDLGKRGYKQWARGCGLNLLVVWFEEALWLANSSRLLKLVVAARSAGILVAVSLQRPSHSSMDTDTRAQLPGNMCFGVEGGDDAAMVLPEDVIASGAAPERWNNRMPGCAYVVAPGIEQRLWSVPLRFDWPREDEAIAAALRRWAHVRTPLDEVTRTAMAPWWDKIEAGNDEVIGDLPPAVDAPAAARSVVATSGLTGVIVDEDFADDGNAVVGDEDDYDDGQSDDDGLPPLGPPIEPDIEDPDAPIGEPPVVEGFRFGEPPPARRLSTQEAQAIVQQHLRTAVAAGKVCITAADVELMKPPTTRSRSWVRLELIRLCEQAQPGEVALEQDMDADKPGVFLLRVPADALAGGR